MPVHAVAGGFQWGSSGKVYRTRAAANRQARAIYAGGWREDVARRALAHQVGASKAAEARYVLDLVGILGAVHRGVMKVVEREHLAPLKQDDERSAIGLSDNLLKRMMRFVQPRVEGAFNRMAKSVNGKAAENSTLVGINPHLVAGVDSAIAHARQANVDLITNASRDFLDQVRNLLEEREGEHPDTLRTLLEERVGVSKSRAALIARDQTLKLNANITQHRQRSAGVTQYVWSTSHDERVRPSHAELDGKTFSWDDPPETSDDGETNHPGEDFQCRCVALPVIDELEKEEPEEPEEPETPEEPEQPEPPKPPEATPLSLGDFAKVMVSRDSPLTVDDVVGHVRHEGIREWLGREGNRVDLEVNTRIARGRNGDYTPSNKKIRVQPKRSSGYALEREATQGPGTFWSWSTRGRAGAVRPNLEAVRDTFTHELGHHVHMNRGPALAEVDRIVSDAYKRLWLDKDGNWKASMPAVMKRAAPSPAISIYAASNHFEYFAESFAAYMSEPQTLYAHDPNGYAMVREVLRATKIEP